MTQKDFDILLVEDNEADVELTLHALRLNHLANRIHVARDGEEALDFLFFRGIYAERSERPQPHLVLLDLILPNKDGWEVLMEMRQKGLLKKIPVIVMSNLGQASDIVRSTKLGATDYIVKSDFSISEVVEKIQKYALSGRNS